MINSQALVIDRSRELVARTDRTEYKCYMYCFQYLQLPGTSGRSEAVLWRLSAPRRVSWCRRTFTGINCVTPAAEVEKETAAADGSRRGASRGDRSENDSNSQLDGVMVTSTGYIFVFHENMGRLFFNSINKIQLGPRMTTHKYYMNYSSPTHNIAMQPMRLAAIRTKHAVSY